MVRLYDRARSCDQIEFVTPRRLKPAAHQRCGITHGELEFRWCRCLLGLVLVVVLTSCAAPLRIHQPAVSPDKLDDVRFVHYLALTPVAGVDEGMRAVLIGGGLEDTGNSFEQRKARLILMGAYKPSWRLEANSALDKGTLAYMVRVVTGMVPSVDERLASLTGIGDRRYALSNCVQAELMRPGATDTYVTGGELVSAMLGMERTLSARSSTSSNP